MYKIETHLHTNHVSSCGHLDAAALAEGYARAGYAAVAVTDHYNRDTFQYLHIDTARTHNVTEPFLEGFRRLRDACAGYGIRVYKGAELRFDESCNDYLLYDCPDELLADPEYVFHLGIAAFAPLAREAGALIVQAHPYRKKCTPAFACYLDGVEVLNLNPRHDSRNDRAEEYAALHGLLRTGGSDCHRTEDIGRGGILSPVLPEDGGGLVRLLREGGFAIIGEAQPAQAYTARPQA